MSVYEFPIAIRELRRSPFFAALTVLTLGLGIAVITALHAVITAVLLHPIAPEHDQLVRIWKNDVARDFKRAPISYVEFLAWRERARGFDGLTAIQYADASTVGVTVGGRSHAVSLTPVAGNFFSVMRIGEPGAGRWFDASDDRASADLVAVVSHGFWQRVAGRDRGFVGQRLLLGGNRSVVVIGIAPPEFNYPIGADLWVPAAAFFDGKAGRFDTTNPRLVHFELIGRLTRGVAIDEARAELSVLQEVTIAQYPADYRGPMPIVVEPLVNTVVGDTRRVLWFLFAAGGLVFVIAGVNVAALLLMRAAGRRSELAVRVALGASRMTLARQTIVESVLLAALAAGAGLLIAKSLLAIVQWISPEDVPRIDNAAIDLSTFWFTIAAVIAWVVALGTVPIWTHRHLAIGRDVPLSQLRARGAPAAGGLRVFTIAEITIAIVISIGAGLLVRSFERLQAIDRGFNSEHLAVVRLLVPEARYPDARRRLTFFEELVSRVAAIPGVVAATPVTLRPGTGAAGLSAPMLFEGQTPRDARDNPFATFEPVTPSYFATLGIPIVQGRGFTDADTRDTAPVAIVSEAVARRYWPGQHPIGKRVQFTSEIGWATVVGVAADHRYRELTKSWLTVYFPVAQFFFFAPGSLIVRTSSPLASFAPAVRQVIAMQDSDVAIESVDAMDALVARELSRPRAALTVMGLFAFLAVLLAAIGVYGVVSYEVRQRLKEWAVRSAIGASPAQIFRGILWRTLTLGSIGAAAGVMLALGGTRFMRALLFEVDAIDPATFLVATAALVVIVLLAAMMPARQAAAVDPVAALQAE